MLIQVDVRDARQDDLCTVKRVHRIIRVHLHAGHLPAGEGGLAGDQRRAVTRVPLPG